MDMLQELQLENALLRQENHRLTNELKQVKETTDAQDALVIVLTKKVLEAKKLTFQNIKVMKRAVRALEDKQARIRRIMFTRVLN